jgi:hypothetical protein
MEDLHVVAAEKKHLNWTSIQGHCLTGGGRAEELYSAERGFAFQETELPHFHLLKGDTYETFRDWRLTQAAASLVAGAWNRNLFVGGWHHTTDRDERVYNVQSHNLFIDLRIPRTREIVLPKDAKCLDDLTPYQLRLYARQHVFAGFSVPTIENEKPLCTRHHCLDWNFVGQGRPRPNKWWIQMNKDSQKWKEYSYATDELGQFYYFETWQRCSRGLADGPRVALRKSASESRDGIFVLVGDHFNYILARELRGNERDYGQGSVVGLVDAAVEVNDLETAKAYLSIEAGHGTLSAGWKLDCAIPPWNEGSTLPFDRTLIKVITGSTPGEAIIQWGESQWDVMDSSFSTLPEMVSFLSSCEYD